MVEGAEALGMTTTRCLAGTGIQPPDLADENALIWAHQEFTVIRTLSAEFGGRPGLGAAIGEFSTIGRTGVIGFMMLAGPTVRAAIERAIPYLALSPTHLRFSLEEPGPGEGEGDEPVVFVVAADDEIPPDVRTFVVERDLAGLAVAFRGAQIDLRLVGIETTLGVESAAALADAWGLAPAAVVANRPTNRLVIPRERLDVRLPQADENTARLFEQQCHDVLAARVARVGVAGQVRSRLSHGRDEWPSMAQVAADLHVDERTLRRRLAAEGTSFRRLTDDVRHAHALELLGQGAAVAEVARELGYSETATFTRSFTRWEGVPPSRRREQIQRREQSR